MSEPSKNFAANCGKTTLYKFRPYATDEERSRIADIIRTHKVYFARPSQLNDPFDLSPRFAPFTRQKLLEGAQEHLKRKGSSTLHREKTLKHLAVCDLNAHATEAQTKARTTMESHWVFSLAGNRSHPMLWSHYAGGHTGLCLHFRSEDNCIFGASMRVDYSDKRPLLPIPFYYMSNHEFFRRIALSKGTFWNYEEEFRFLRFPDTDFTDVGLQFVDQFCHFPANALSGITVGARMPELRVQEVRALATEHDPTLPVWRAVETDTYDFEFNKLSA